MSWCGCGRPGSTPSTASSALTARSAGRCRPTHQRNLRVSFTWMPAPSVYGWPGHRERQRSILEQAAAHFDAGDLRVEIGATFPLERTADAHRALEAGQVTGKAVLLMGPD